MLAPSTIYPFGLVSHSFRDEKERGNVLHQLNNSSLARRIIENRNERFAAFNGELILRNLKPFTHPDQLGDSSKPGQLEIVGIYAISSDDPRFHWDVITIVRDNNGRFETRSMRWNANSAVSDGAIAIVFIQLQWGDIYLLLTHQWRQQLGEYRHEAPRGYAEASDMYTLIDTPDSTLLDPRFQKMKGVTTLLRELGEEVGDPTLYLESLHLSYFMHLGRVPQNTGTDTATPDYFLLMLTSPEWPTVSLQRKFYPSEHGHSVVLLKTEDIAHEIPRLDNFTMTGLLLTLAKIPQGCLPFNWSLGF